MVSSLVLGSTILSLTGLLAAPASAQSGSTYTLDTEYSGDSFFDGFTFFTDADPTNGFVDYVSESEALSDSLISSGAGVPAVMGVDHTTTLASDGSEGYRKSVRLTSNKSWTHGLFIGDFNHMPGGICGTWPAFWTYGPSWPTNGEIDIIEGVNDATNNLMSLHTSSNCTIAGADETGTLQTNNCDTSVNYNSGCGVTDASSESYGTGFNDIGGGVYAMQWTSDYIRIWFFARGSIPTDITAGSPDPSGWGNPAANMEGSCDIDSHFADHNIIFDTTFCGDYGNAVWSSDSVCSAKASTCNAYVAENPSAFADAYWSVNSVKVYVLSGTSSNTTTTSSSSLSSSSPASSVAGPGMGNSTSASSTAQSTNSGSYAVASATSTTSSAATGNPTLISGYEYYGCYGSTGNFSSFNLASNTSSMSNDECVSTCSASGYTFSGTYLSQCYCGSNIDSSTTKAAGSCNIPCPGNSAESCGGNVVSSAKYVRRAAPNNILLSLYASVAVVGSSSSSSAVVSTTTSAGASGSNNVVVSISQNIVISASGTGAHYYAGGSTYTSSSLSSVSPAYATIGYGMGGPATTTVLTTTYVDVCPTGLATSTAVVTVAQCGCTNTVGGLATTTAAASPTIAMTTATKECTACAATGGPATVTVTLPATTAASANTTPASAAAQTTTIAGQATTTLQAATSAQAATGVSYNNGTVAGTASPTMLTYTGEGEIVTASGFLCAVMFVVAMIL